MPPSAAAARNKLKIALKQIGIVVEGENPPTDTDFIRAINDYLDENYIPKHIHIKCSYNGEQFKTGRSLPICENCNKALHCGYIEMGINHFNEPQYYICFQCLLAKTDFPIDFFQIIKSQNYEITKFFREYMKLEVRKIDKRIYKLIEDDKTKYYSDYDYLYDEKLIYVDPYIGMKDVPLRFWAKNVHFAEEREDEILSLLQF